MVVQHDQSNRSPFENGSMTQPLMMCLAFEHAGIDFDLFADQECAYFNYRARALSALLKSDPTTYAAVLMIWHITVFEDSPELAAMAQNARIVHVLCGHHAIFSLEDIIFGKNRCADMLVNKYASDTWIFDMHAEFASLYEHWLNTPVHAYPYVWSSAIVDAHMREHGLLTPPAVSAMPRLPLTIVIAEPSLNVTKSCFLPLIAVNAYARAHPERVRRVILLCKPNGPGFEAFAHYMDAIHSKLEMHDRLVWAGVACQLMHRRDTVPILFSHHMFNAMNFLSLETMYMGMPIVHNADALRPAGFFYEGWDVAAAHKQLDRIWEGERNAEISRSILHRYDPANAEVRSRFAKLLDCVRSPEAVR